MRSHFLFVLAIAAFLIAAARQANAAQLPSPVEQRIEAARASTEANPKSWQAFNDLATAICRKARDYQDPALFDQAEVALHRSLQLSPDNYGAQKLEVAVLLGKCQFEEALRLAIRLNHKVPDDIGGWGLLVDSNVALGNYAEAEHAAQWILDLRPGSSLGFVKAAGLRELFGDSEGAIEFYDEAGRRTSRNDADERAWLMTQNARLYLGKGSLQTAEELLAGAARLFPDSQLALGTLAQLRVAQGNYPAATQLLEQRYRTVQSTANLYEWAEALEKSGRREEAERAFQDFEVKARAETHGASDSDLSLIFYYADHRKDFSEALALATQRSTLRHDSATLDAYAWALYQSGKYSEAKIQMDRALIVGVRNPGYFCHAAHIAQKAKDGAGVARFEKELTALGANSCSRETAVAAATGGATGGQQ